MELRNFSALKETYFHQAFYIPFIQVLALFSVQRRDISSHCLETEKKVTSDKIHTKAESKLLF